MAPGTIVAKALRQAACEAAAGCEPAPRRFLERVNTARVRAPPPWSYLAAAASSRAAACDGAAAGFENSSAPLSTGVHFRLIASRI